VVFSTHTGLLTGEPQITMPAHSAAIIRRR